MYYISEWTICNASPRVPALENIFHHSSSSLTTAITSWTVQTAGSYNNVTAGHWYNCILARGHVSLLSSQGPGSPFFLQKTPGGVWFLLQSEGETQHQHSEIIHHKHDIFLRFLHDLIVIYFIVFMSALNHISIHFLSVPWQKQVVLESVCQESLKNMPK